MADDILEDRIPEAAPVEEPAPEPELETEAAPVEETPPETKMFKVKVDGEEMEVTEEELRKGYQTARHLTQKGQKLAEEEKALAAHQGILKHWENPEFVKHAMGFFDKPATQPEQPPEDPFERIKWDARQEALQGVQPTLDKQAQEIAQIRKDTDAGTLHSQLAARDGQDYQVVVNNLESFIQSKFPPTAAASMIKQANDDRQTFIEVYDMALADLRHYMEQNPAEETPEDNPKPQVPQIKRTPVKPPVLETPAADTSEAERLASKKETAKLKAKALRDGDPDAMGQWFEKIGLIDHLA